MFRIRIRSRLLLSVTIAVWAYFPLLVPRSAQAQKILFQDTFTGGKLDGTDKWHSVSGQWSIVGGKLVQTKADGKNLILVTDEHWDETWVGAGQTKPACFENNGQNAVLGDRNLFDEECASNMAAKRTADGFIIEGKLKFKTIFKQSTKPNLPIPTDGTIWGFDSTA